MKLFNTIFYDSTMWLISLIIAVAIIIVTAVLAIGKAKRKYKTGVFFTASRIVFLGVVLSSIVLFIPIYIRMFTENAANNGDYLPGSLVEPIAISIHNMIRLFVVDGDFEFITSNISDISSVGVIKGEWISCAYSILFSVLFVLAPILTFGFVLSFLKNLQAYKKYITHYSSDIFVFSELNERSLALAESMAEDRKKKQLFVFTDVFDDEGERSFELSEKAKELGAICFKKDIVTVKFPFHSKKAIINMFTIGEDQSENIVQAVKLIDINKYVPNTRLYVFSVRAETELLLSNAFNSSHDDDIQIRVRCVNEAQSLVHRILYDDGINIFNDAKPCEDGSSRISAVVIGMGSHGTEMTRSLAWFCQMDGYSLGVNCFDVDKRAASRFESLCPELMDEKHNNDFETKGEAHYSIKINSGYDVDTKLFDDAISRITDATYVFVALGDDEKNIATAVKLRSIFERMGIKPRIQAIVYNTQKKVALGGITNFKGQPYDIDFVGDMRTSYSEKVIMYSEVEQIALARHMKWGKEQDFWRYSYNYKSSIASAIHRHMKSLCKIPGIDKAPGERTEEELWSIRDLEHRRWNAYMRSEGYSYAEKRNDLAKTHHCLVPFDALPYEEQVKDDD